MNQEWLVDYTFFRILAAALTWFCVYACLKSLRGIYNQRTQGEEKRPTGVET